MTDDDLIRRGDVLREIANEGLHILDAAIAALPARGVGVKPLVWQPIVKGARRPVGLVLLYRKSVTAEDKLVAAICKGTPEASDEILLGKWRDGAWRQWNTGWTVNGVTHWMPLPEPPEILAALTPTDAAHVNETPKSEHDAGNVLTDAAQAREAAQEHRLIAAAKEARDIAIRHAALRELIDAYEDIMDYGIVFAKKPQQDRLNAAKEKLKETQ